MGYSKYDMANILLEFTDSNGNTVYNNNDSITLNLLDTNTSSYINHVVAETDTYQTISYRYYGTTRLWWLVAKFNDVQDATDRPKRGTVLKILTPNLVTTVLSNIANVN